MSSAEDYLRDKVWNDLCDVRETLVKVQDDLHSISKDLVDSLPEEVLTSMSNFIDNTKQGMQTVHLALGVMKIMGQV